MKVLRRCALLTFLVLTAASQLRAAPLTGPNHWCATHPGRLLISAARHDLHQRHLARERLAGRLPMKSAATILQDGQIAILEDDGTVTRPPGPFDLQDRAIQFLRRPKGMSAVRSNPDFKQLVGDRLELGDADSVEVSLPVGFEFPFGDRAYTSVWVNSNGILSFGQPSPAIGLYDFLYGPPAIAALFTDLDPSSAEGENGVFVNVLSNRVRITWRDVPQFSTGNSNTFQVTLFSTGRITVVYGDVDALTPIVGVAPPFEDFDDFHFLDYSEELPLSPRRAAIAELFTMTPEVDVIGAVQAFTESFRDVYTSVFIWLDFPAVTPFFAYAIVLQNDVGGIGLDVFDITNLLFPASRNLESFVDMGELSRFPDDPDEIFRDTASTMVILGHEFGHRWLTYVRFIDGGGNPSYDLLNFPGGSHWSFFTNSEGSLIHGNAWDDHGDGSFSATTRAHTRYNPLDRYLMGLASPASVPDFFYIASPAEPISPGTLPIFEGTVHGERVDVSIADVRAAEGPRRPAPAASPRSFRTAFLLVSLVGQDAAPESIAKLDRYRRRWVSYFREATGNRGEVTTALFPR